MNKSLPLVRIAYTRLLDPHLKELFELKGGMKEETIYPSQEVIESRLENFLATWKPYEERILLGLTQVTGLHFFQNTIDVYVVGRMRGAFSFPMVVSSHYEPDRFIDILTHEMTHRLLTDNTTQWTPQELLRSKFPEEIMLVRNHILVHATLQGLWFDVLQEPTRLERDLKFTEAFPAYKRAWDIVKENGYKELLGLIKK